MVQRHVHKAWRNISRLARRAGLRTLLLGGGILVFALVLFFLGLEVWEVFALALMVAYLRWVLHG
jgi:hypothetical protein